MRVKVTYYGCSFIKKRNSKQEMMRNNINKILFGLYILVILFIISHLSNSLYCLVIPNHDCAENAEDPMFGFFETKQILLNLKWRYLVWTQTSWYFYHFGSIKEKRNRNISFERLHNWWTGRNKKSDGSKKWCLYFEKLQYWSWGTV